MPLAAEALGIGAFANRRTCVTNFVASHTVTRQEPITQSIQLLCACAMAFSQVGLFLDLPVFPVKLNVSDGRQVYKFS